MLNSPRSDSRPLAVTIGEPAGIGVDIILNIWHQRATFLPPNFLLICDPDHLKKRAQLLGLNIEIQIAEIGNNATAVDGSASLKVVPLKNRLQGQPGNPHPGDSEGIIEAISTGVNLVKDGHAGGVVTLPINKKSLYDAGFNHPGHTEFLGALADQWENQADSATPVMMLAGPELKAVPVTIHIPLAEVSGALTTDNIVNTVVIADRDLRSRFGIPSPRIAVSGLNPHAGEGGTMGTEDEAIIAPALSRLQSMGIGCFGPLPADTMFHGSARTKYDLAVCMYHDQALIPAKALAFDKTVNVTLGLPFIRTSPDHGTAFDLAGTGKANPNSTLAAMRMAEEMALTQAQVDVTP